MLAYILKSAITLALLYCLFFAFLSRETFHRFNRVCLLLTMILSLVLPLVHMTVSQPSAINEAIQSSEAYITEAPVPVLFEYGPIAAESEQSAAAEEVAAAPLTWETLLTYIYLIGVAVMVLFILFHTVQMIRLIRGGLRHTDGQGNTVILKPGIQSPFSLFHWIVMSVEDYEQHRDSILVHEQEHIRLHHTYDLLLLEAVRVLQWFNPFIWFMGHDLKNIHEYEADEAVVNQGIDAKQYQQLLVLKAVGNRLQPFANNLRRGSLKQRFIMMYQKKSNRWMMLKALFILPVVGFVLNAFAAERKGDMTASDAAMQRFDTLSLNAPAHTMASRLALPDSLLTADEQVQKRTLVRLVQNNLHVRNDSLIIGSRAKDYICATFGEETYQELVNNVKDINDFLRQLNDTLREEALSSLEASLRPSEPDEKGSILYDYSIHLSMTEEELQSLSRFGNNNFIGADSRFYRNLRKKDGKIVQPLSKEELNISETLYTYFQIEIADINRMIDEGQYTLRESEEGNIILDKMPEPARHGVKGELKFQQEPITDQSQLVHQLTVGSTYYDGKKLILTSKVEDFTSKGLQEAYYSNYAMKVKQANAAMKKLKKATRRRAMADYPYYCQRADSIILSKPVTISPVADHSKKNLYFRYGVGPISEEERINASMYENGFIFTSTPFTSVDIVYDREKDLPVHGPRVDQLVVINGRPVRTGLGLTLFYPEVRDMIENVTFMSEEESVKAYGEAGRNGSIHVTMKPGFKNDLLEEWDFRETLMVLTTYATLYEYYASISSSADNESK